MKKLKKTEYLTVLEVDLKRYGRAYNTQRNYRTSLNILVNRYGLDFEKLLTKPKTHGQQVIDTILENDSASVSIHAHIASMKALLRAYDLEHGIKWKYPKQRERKYRDRLPTVAELKYILNNASLKQKVILLLLISSGMRIGSLEHLRLKDFTYNDEHGLVKINVYSTKTRHQYTTFATKEFWDIFQQWISELKNNNEIDDNSLIFEKYYFSNKGRKKIVKNWWTTRMSAELNIRLFDRCELLERNDGILKFTAHTLRKFFKTACVVSGIPELYSELMLGHKSGIQQTYFRPSDEMMMMEYKKVAERLTINGSSTTLDAGHEMRLKTLEKNMERMMNILS